jgi:DNA-3-methyladenine glycosylase
VSRSTRRLPRSFFVRPSPEVGPDLLGRILVRRLGDGQLLSARIVETEAYQEDDPASHSYRGRTNRTEVMFGPPGHLYVYFTYGMHHCLNVVTGSDGEGSAVLLRAAEPLEGVQEMARRRGTDDPRALCSGPGRLCQALGIAREENGLDVVRGHELWLLEGTPVSPPEIDVGSRVGITRGIECPWRFSVQGDRFVSRVRGGGPVRGSR